MLPTLEDGDRLLVRRRWRPAVGDLVLVQEPGSAHLVAVKRVAWVGHDEVVVLGDNPGASRDSRTYGAVPRSSILGKAWWRYHPAARSGRLPSSSPARP
ncbi:MAG: Signal peptidase, partial [Acidimicrobiaceae bacterium]|nr:Signal peptidase [Acidimicrobiaceae bacterium]